VLIGPQGLVYRQGKFSEIEESQLRSAIEDYRIVSDRISSILVAKTGHQRNGLTPEQLNEVIFAKERTKDKEFWQEISASSQARRFFSLTWRYSYRGTPPTNYRRLSSRQAGVPPSSRTREMV